MVVTAVPDSTVAAPHRIRPGLVALPTAAAGILSAAPLPAAFGRLTPAVRPQQLLDTLCHPAAYDSREDVDRVPGNADDDVRTAV